MLSAAAVAAEFVGGKATRDALFLTSLDVAALPAMLIATSVCSILLVVTHAKWGEKVPPATLVPASFVASGLLFVAEWFFRSQAPAATAVIVYLHISGAGPLLASGFWLVATDRFDPRTAKRRFGQITGAGTLGGLFGALMAERVAALAGVPAMLLVLACFQFVAAWLVRMLAVAEAKGFQPRPVSALAAGAAPQPLRSGFRVIAEAAHLRHLIALVLLGTTSAALLEYLFKAQAVATLGRGDGLLRFFALYYAGTSLLAFLLQTLGSRTVLERFGLALTTSTPSIALLAGSVGSLVAPGFGSLVVARAGESVLRGSWFRAGYELFYTPLPAAEKRAAKSIIDVGVDRLGDAVGGGFIRLALIFLPVVSQAPVILSAAMAASVGAIVAAGHLNRWYIRSLENSLIHQAGPLDLSFTQDGSMANVFLSIKRRNENGRPRSLSTAAEAPVDPVIRDILALRSGDRERITDVLMRRRALPAVLVAHVIPLLGRDSVADFALFALRKVAEERVGELVDALIDPNQDYTVRRRLARVFSICVSQRAVDGLMLGLEDPRFDVRFQSARSLSAIQEKNPGVVIDRQKIEAVVLREVAVEAPIWEGRRLLDRFVSESPLDVFVKDRAGQSLAHVFTLLGLVMPREPLQIAFRSLQSEDRRLRGTALEYLEGVLPAPIRQALWPFLAYRRDERPVQQRTEIYANLLRSKPSETLVAIAEKLNRRPAAGS
jgi:hypothetical protein